MAQPYVYGVTRLGFFNGIHYTEMTPRLVTIDPLTGQAIASLPLAGCSEGTGVAVRADGQRVYVTCNGETGRLLVVDPVAKQVVSSRTFTARPDGLAITPANDRLVVRFHDQAEVVDATSLATLGTIVIGGSTGSQPSVVVSNDGSRAYFSRRPAFLETTLVVANLTDFTTTVIAMSGNGGGDLALNMDGTRLIVGGEMVSIFDTATNAVVATYDPPEAGLGALVADATRAYVATSSAVLVIDLASGTLAAEWPLPLLQAIELRPAGARLYTANGHTFRAVDLASGTVLLTGAAKGVFDIAAPPASPAIVPDACSYAVAFRRGSFTSPPPRESPAGSTDWRIDVFALPDRCTWTAQSDVPWITLERASGTGPDNVGITIAANATGQPRTGTITIGGQALSIAQAGCTNSIVFFDRPGAGHTVAQPFVLGGWAIDTCSAAATGLTDPFGMTGYGRARPDVAAAFGAQFLHSGFEFVAGERRPGLQDVTVVLRNTITDADIRATIRVNVLPSVAPFGVIDTPTEAATVAGDLPLTGWILDDVGLFGGVAIYRDTIPGEASSAATPGKVFVGSAARVAGARPDVKALFPTYPDSDRAGFGAMILTNALPNGGNGTFTFHVQVTDLVHATWLGPRTVTVDNLNSPLPFGAVDTPGPGQTVSGVITVHGWALTPGTAMIPVDGSTIDVIVDGQVVGHPTYNQARPDVQALFPGYTNAAAPGGSFTLDSRLLSNGTHTIAWVVRDNAGNAKGIGSRFFTVQNSASATR